MATPRKKITPKKTHQQSSTSKIVEVALLILVLYISQLLYTSNPYPFEWNTDIRGGVAGWLLCGFFILLFKWR